MRALDIAAVDGIVKLSEVSLHCMHYNFGWPHPTLTKDNGGYKTTPAMAAGIENRIWTPRDIAALLD